MAYRLTARQARQFLLLKHGLAGPHRFAGKPGVLDFVRQAGCIQYDPIDVCGRNADLVLQARVQGYRKAMLQELLYEDRQLIDYFDKNLSIIPAEDWKYFARYREAYRVGGRSHERVDAVCAEIQAIIRERGAVASADLDFQDTVSWYWSDTKLSRAALETLYFRGDLVIHHKKGTIKYYDLAENCLPAATLQEPDPWPDESAHRQWRVWRRIGSVGLLWNRPSDAWLNIAGLTAADRQTIFTRLLAAGQISEITVEGVPSTLFCRSGDRELAETVLNGSRLSDRCELLAPLDNLLWDRKLIRVLFGFDYKWEIYTPAAQRRYGYYVLPVLYGDGLIGRLEAVNNRKAACLEVRNYWPEDGGRPNGDVASALRQVIERLAKLHDCRDIRWLADNLPQWS